MLLNLNKKKKKKKIFYFKVQHRPSLALSIKCVAILLIHRAHCGFYAVSKHTKTPRRREASRKLAFAPNTCESGLRSVLSCRDEYERTVFFLVNDP